MSSEYNRKDHLYEKAKSEGYRSRAAYKLKELNQRFKLFNSGGKILDLGAWPGGWIQVAAEVVGPKGIIVGLDLVELEPFAEENVHLLVGSANDPELINQALALLGGNCDAVLSDMSQKLTGIKEADQAGSVACGEAALAAAERGLKRGGHMVVKVFKGNDTDQFVKSLRSRFNKISRAELDASRTTSNEYYIVAQGFGVPKAGKK